jgi:hypothetical protein
VHAVRAPDRRRAEEVSEIPEGSSLDNDGADRQTYEEPNCDTETSHKQHFHSPVGGLTLNCPGVLDGVVVEELACTEPDWPWQALGELADEVYEVLKERVREVMVKGGENPDHAQMFVIRVEQVAHSVKARAEREGR